MLGYAFKRIIRGWPLFIAVIAGVIISSSTFATINLGSNIVFDEAIDHTFNDVVVDMEVEGFFYKPTASELEDLTTALDNLELVQHAALITRMQDIEYFGHYGSPSLWDACVAIENDSWVWDEINIINASMSLPGVNQTFLVNSSTIAGNYQLHDLYNLTFVFVNPSDETYYFENMTVEIVGFVNVSDAALSILLEEGWELAPEHNLFLFTWEDTFRPFMVRHHEDHFGFRLHPPPAFTHHVQLFMDRDAILNPFDMPGTLATLVSLEDIISTIVEARPGAYIRFFLKYKLEEVFVQFQELLFTFITSSIPIFFITLYMGITLSDVSFNLRRRETGLLLTKGVTRPSVLRIFLTETVVVGLISGFVGLFIALMIIPILIGAPISSILLTEIGWLAIFLSIIFACVVAIISVYPAASRSSRLSTIELLREYSTVTPGDYSRLGAYAALALGGYKIITWLAGLNPTYILAQNSSAGFLVQLLLTMWVLYDSMLAYVAVILFLYGFTKIAVQGSTLIYRISERVIQRSLGDIGVLASRSIQRNPGRTAAVVFILALVLGTGVQSATILASEGNYVVRSVYTDVGADISAIVTPASDGWDLIPEIENISGIVAATMELQTPLFSGISLRIETVGIDVGNWTQIAYYEESWFSIISSNQAFEALSLNNRSIILQYGLAREHSFSIGDKIQVVIGNRTTSDPILVNVTVAGFFGPEYTSNTGDLSEGQYSLVSDELLEGIRDTWLIGRLLIKTAPTADIDTIIETLKDFVEISNVKSVKEQLSDYGTNSLLSAPSNMMRVGIVFAFVLASVGTLIIINLTLREKRYETALMAARGLSYRQIAQVLLAESTSWVVFAVLIGLATGLVAAYGAIQNLSFLNPFLPRSIMIIFSGEVFIPILIMVGFLVLFSLVPMFFAARHAQSGIEVLRQ